MGLEEQRRVGGATVGGATVGGATTNHSMRQAKVVFGTYPSHSIIIIVISNIFTIIIIV